VSQGIAYVTLARPRVLNAFNHEQRVKLTQAFERASEDPAVRVIVLAGEGRAFCAGQDQRESAAFDEDTAQRRLETYEKLFQTMRHCTKPIIAQVHGYAAGAGFQLALMADMRIAGTSMKMGMTELKIGSPPIVGSAMLLPILGEARMRQLILTAEFVDAERALAWGLVNEVVPDDALAARVARMASTLEGWDPGPVARVKTWMTHLGEDLFTHAWDQAKVIHRENFRAGSLVAGAKKFVERKG
jgi:enoyl-CoA hydratase/carnithine racemase